jgi:hypothetical protein
MTKRRGNPSWGKPELVGPVTSTINEFEQAFANSSRDRINSSAQFAFASGRVATRRQNTFLNIFLRRRDFEIALTI